MKYKRILMYVTPVLCFILFIVSYLQFLDNRKEDSIKFKEEYESLNGKDSYADKKYSNLKISLDNPIKYSNYAEILEVINDGTGIIYLGFPECPWCRSAIPVLLDVAKDKDIEVIYYLNIKSERDSYVIEDNKVVYALDDNGIEIKGTEGYFKLLEVLDENLSDYVITYENKSYEVGEKRIFAPSVIFVKDGNVLGIHVSTVESHTDGYSKLTDEEYEELYSIYEDYINRTYSSTCTVGSSC